MLQLGEIILHLRALPLFERLTNAQLLALADAVSEESHPAGGVVVREGEYDACIYFVISGSLVVVRGNERVATIAPGGFFGEMAALENAPRSATVSAMTPVRVLKLGRKDLLRLMRDLPGIAIAMCQALSSRLRALNSRFGMMPDEPGSGATGGDSADPS